MSLDALRPIREAAVERARGALARAEAELARAEDEERQTLADIEPIAEVTRAPPEVQTGQWWALQAASADRTRRAREGQLRRLAEAVAVRRRAQQELENSRAALARAEARRQVVERRSERLRERSRRERVARSEDEN